MTCPYCGGDTFETDAKLEKAPTLNGVYPNNDAVWVNQCCSCKGFSLYDEATDVQTALPDDRKETG